MVTACAIYTRIAVAFRPPCVLTQTSGIPDAWERLDGRSVKEVMVDEEKLVAVPGFCCLGDMLSAGGGCELATITR